MMRNGLPEIMEGENNVNRPKPDDFICSVENIFGIFMWDNSDDLVQAIKNIKVIFKQTKRQVIKSTTKILSLS
jgi:hypothetical protein